uniref:Uncharacterized protein n=1 Tax=Sipha flava TaxID=143950 RepID=A0A2S2PW78_9HEMI
MLHERSKQFEHLSRVESAFFILLVARLHVLFTSTEVHSLPENILSRIIAKVFAGTEHFQQIGFHPVQLVLWRGGDLAYHFSRARRPVLSEYVIKLIEIVQRLFDELVEVRVGDGPLPDAQKFSGGHGGGGGLGRSVGRRYLLPVLGELVHHPHAHQSHRGQQSQPDEVYVRLDGGAHHQHQESDQRDAHDFPATVDRRGGHERASDRKSYGRRNVRRTRGARDTGRGARVVFTARYWLTRDRKKKKKKKRRQNRRLSTNTYELWPAEGFLRGRTRRNGADDKRVHVCSVVRQRLTVGRVILATTTVGRLPVRSGRGGRSRRRRRVTK